MPIPPLPRRALLLGAASLAVSAHQAFARTGVVGAVVGPGGGACVAPPIGIDFEVGQTFTTCSGQTINLLFADGTSFTLGPDSSAQINHFHFDPGSGDGLLVIRLLRGIAHIVRGVLIRVKDRIEDRIHDRIRNEVRQRVREEIREEIRHEIRVETLSGVLSAQNGILTVSVIDHVTICLVAQGQVREFPSPAEASDTRLLPRLLLVFKAAITAAILSHDLHGKAGAAEVAPLSAEVESRIRARLRAVETADRTEEILGEFKGVLLRFLVSLYSSPLQNDRSPALGRNETSMSIDRELAKAELDRAHREELRPELRDRTGSEELLSRRPSSVVQKISAAITNRPYQANLPPRR